MPNRALAVDANILVRAVLGKRVRAVIEAHAEDVSFFVPEAAYCEAEEHLPTLVVKHGGDPEKVLSLLRCLRSLMVPIGSDVYGEFENEARQRLAARDPEEWPIWPPRWHPDAQSGQRTRISLGAGWPYGPPTASYSSCVNDRFQRIAGHASKFLATVRLF